MKINIIKLYFLLIYFFSIIKDTLYTITNNVYIETQIGRMISLITLIFSMIIILTTLRTRIIINKIKKEGIIVVFMFFLSIDISNIINNGTLLNNNIYYLMILFSIMLIDYKSIDNEELLNDFSKYLFLYCLISLLITTSGYGFAESQTYSVIKQDFTYTSAYTTGIFSKFIPFRLQGISLHANTLGFMSLILIIINIRNNKLFQIIGLITLILSQSKTAIFSLIFCLIYLIYIKGFKNKKNILHLFILISLIIVFLIFIIFIKHINFDWTFTGRINIWKYALEKWSDNFFTIMTGCGKYLFSEELNSGVLALRQAHNQIIHTLSSEGIFGLMCFLSLIVFLIKYNWKIFKRDNSKIKYILIIIVILIRCFSETPFRDLAMPKVEGLVFIFLLINIINKTSHIENKLSI